MNFKYLLSISLVLLLSSAGLAQQNPQFSQYLQNSLILNPAIIGAEDITEFTLGYRNQWTGFEGAPRTPPNPNPSAGPAH